MVVCSLLHLQGHCAFASSLVNRALHQPGGIVPQVSFAGLFWAAGALLVNGLEASAAQSSVADLAKAAAEAAEAAAAAAEPAAAP